MKLKKIAFFSPDLAIGGVEKVFIDYANYLENEGYDVEFILVHRRGTLLSQLSSSIRIVELDGDRLRFVIRSLAKVLKNEHYDYLISGTEKTNVIAFLANYIAGRKTKTVTSQHNFMDVESSSFIHKYLLPIALKKSYFTFAVSKAIQRMLTEMGLKRNKTEVLYNPLNIDFIKTQSTEELSIELPNKYILFVGRFYEVKNIPLLLEAFAMFSKVQQDFKLVMVGDGVLKAQLIYKAIELEIDNKIIWVGSTNNPYPFIKNATVVAVSSLFESLSNVVLESICLGRTVVTTPCLGPIEILQPPTYGYSTKSFNDAKEYSETLSKAVEAPIDVMKLQTRSLDFDISVSANKLIKILS